MIIVRLVPWDQRTMKQQTLTQELYGKVSNFPGARAFPVNPGSLGQRGTSQPIQFVLGGPDYNTLRDWRDIVMQKAQETGLFLNMDSNYKESQPDIRVQIDRQRAADLNVSIEEIGRTLELMFGETEISTFVSRGEEYPVIMRGRPEDRASPSDLTNTFIRAGTGDLVPLSAFVSLTESAAPQTLNRFNRLRSITHPVDPARPACPSARAWRCSNRSSRPTCRPRRASAIRACRRISANPRTPST